MPATFKIKNNFQRRKSKYQDLLGEDILRDICERLTGQSEFEIVWNDDGYNKGRLAILEYNNRAHYISFSEPEVRSRNSFFQSFPSALVQFYLEQNHNKGIYYYFLTPENDSMNIETPYFKFMYRLIKTVGTVFLNESDYLSEEYSPFNSASDVINSRNFNKSKNPGNASTYATINENNILQIFGKTYGANKYETILLSLALHKVSASPIEIYEIQESGLDILPQPGRQLLIDLGMQVITSDLELEKHEFEDNDSLRSPTYLYNLLEKLGEKKCCFCGCEIPQIIHGAHIWPVASIKKSTDISLDEKVHHALSADNGIWLCSNHHKLFDINILFVDAEGRLRYKTDIEDTHKEYLDEVTLIDQIENEILTPTFVGYLEKRNMNLDINQYSFIQ